MSMDWFPVVFIVFKLALLGVGMFFAIKWHYDKGKRAKASAKPSVRSEQTPKVPE